MQSYEILQKLVTDNCYSEESIHDLFDHWYNCQIDQIILFKGNLYNIQITRENLLISVIKFCLRMPRKVYKISVSPINC